MSGSLRELLKHDATSGIVLIACAALALILDNSPLAPLYDALLSTPVAVQIGALILDKPLLLWINDGLMAIFFFLVGLEIKRELVEGQLSSWSAASLPLMAAIGGMVAPASIYVFFNWQDPVALNGWAIPAATDIAFVLGVLALLGKRVPVELKVFLLALAVIDDLGAILIIAIFYTAELSLVSLGLGFVGLAALIYLNMRGVTHIAPYVLIGIFMWVCVLKSGVHATLAGVLIALTIPLKGKNEHGESPLIAAEHGLKPWVGFLIMPAFAFANAGVALGGLSMDDLVAPLPAGIALGLLVGKPVGILFFTWLGTVLGICRLPASIGWVHVIGAGFLAGIGFTMSLFIGTLAFASADHAAAVRIGVLSGSTIAAILGYALLHRAAAPNKTVQQEAAV